MQQAEQTHFSTLPLHVTSRSSSNAVSNLHCREVIAEETSICLRFQCNVLTQRENIDKESGAGASPVDDICRPREGNQSAIPLHVMTQRKNIDKESGAGASQAGNVC